MEINGDGEVKGIGHNMSIWRIANLISGDAMLKVVYQESLTAWQFFPFSSFMSENYIVARLEKNIPNEKKEVLIEVRSTANFKVVYSIKERAAKFHCFGFVKDVLAVYMIFQNGRKFIRWNQIILFQLKTGTIYFIIFVL